MIKNGNYYVVQSFMVTELKLKGLERDLYAIIYGFSQAEGKFTGSLQYLCDWTMATKQGIVKCLKSLQERNLIARNERIINNLKFVEYYTTELHSIQPSLTGYATEFNGGMQLSCPNNIDDNKDNNINKRRSGFNEILAEISNDELKSEIQEFIKFRAIKKPLTTHALKLNLKELYKLSDDIQTQIAIVRQSIMKGWQGFFQLKDNKPMPIQTPKFSDNDIKKYARVQ